MSSVVDICNVALSHLGNARRVAAIDPPDGTAEADLCSVFYPIARDEMLEAADWSFARKRVALSLLSTNDSTVWAYAYGKPADSIMYRRIVTGIATAFEVDSEAFDSEGDVIYTNKADAVMLYTKALSDPTKFPPTFRSALSYMLASYLAGPILKGDEGAKAGQTLRKGAMALAMSAASSDSNRTFLDNLPFPSGLLARNGSRGSTSPSTDVNDYGTGYAVN